MSRWVKDVTAATSCSEWPLRQQGRMLKKKNYFRSDNQCCLPSSSVSSAAAASFSLLSNFPCCGRTTYTGNEEVCLHAWDMRRLEGSREKKTPDLDVLKIPLEQRGSLDMASYCWQFISQQQGSQSRGVTVWVDDFIETREYSREKATSLKKKKTAAAVLDNNLLKSSSALTIIDQADQDQPQHQCLLSSEKVWPLLWIAQQNISSPRDTKAAPSSWASCLWRAVNTSSQHSAGPLSPTQQDDVCCRDLEATRFFCRLCRLLIAFLCSAEAAARSRECWGTIRWLRWAPSYKENA